MLDPSLILYSPCFLRPLLPLVFEPEAQTLFFWTQRHWFHVLQIQELRVDHKFLAELELGELRKNGAILELQGTSLNRENVEKGWGRGMVDAAE